MKLTQVKSILNELEIELVCHPEHIAIEGNASAIDPETDQKIADDINEQLDRGNQWAWCFVEVKVSWRGIEASDSLSACSYKSEEDFKACGYFKDMVATAKRELLNEIESVQLTPNNGGES